MSNHGARKGMLIRLGVIAVLGAVAIVVALSTKSSMTISEIEVKRMVRERELIGVTLREAARRLQHKDPGTRNGTAVFEFDQIKGWSSGHLLLDVFDGRVTAASWVKGIEANNVRQDQGDGGDGGAAQGQGAPTGIRATNQTSGGGGPR